MAKLNIESTVSKQNSLKTMRQDIATCNSSINISIGLQEKEKKPNYFNNCFNQFVYEAKQMKKCFSFASPIRDWRIIFCSSSVPHIITPYELLAIRCIYFLLFLLVEIYDQTKTIIKTLNGRLLYPVYYIYFTNWTHIVILFFLFSLICSHIYGLRTLQNNNRELDEELNISSVSTSVNKLESETQVQKCFTLSSSKNRNLVKEFNWNTDQKVKKKFCKNCFSLEVEQLENINENCGDLYCNQLPLIAKIAFLYNCLSICSCIVTCIVYWTILVPNGEFSIGFISLCKHLFNFILLSIHMCISRLPLCIPQIVFLLIFSISYVLLTIFIFLFKCPNFDGGYGYAYRMINFSNIPVKASIYLICVSLVLSNLVFLTVWIFSWRISYFYNPFDFPYFKMKDGIDTNIDSKRKEKHFSFKK